MSGVKLAALRGDLAVLSQTESVNESFYDLFNQHFKQQTTADGVTRHFANIAVGAMSKPCLVHPNFQCLVHVRASELPHIPAPFLNRFEKYRLSQVDLLRAGLSSMSNRQDEGLARLLDAAVKKVRELVQLMGTKSFYGSVDGQTLESVFVDMLPRAGVSSSDATAHTGSTGAVYQNVLLSTAHTYLHGQLVLRACTGIGEDNLLEAVSAQLPSLRAHLDSAVPLSEPTNGLSISLSQLSERGVAEPRAQLIGASLYHLLVHSAVARLLQLATPEAVYCFKGRLPKSLMRVYFETEHFSLQRLIRRVCSDGAGKHLVYTRTTPAVHRLPNRTPDTDLSAEARKYLQSAVHTRADEIALIYRLAQFSSEDAFQTMLSEWTSDDKHRLLLLVVDMNVISITRVNFVRLKFEQLHTQPHKSVVMLLHFPLSDAHVRACYPALFLAGWEHTFLDAVGQSDDGPASLEIKKMLQVACDLDDSFDPTHALHASLEYAMHIVASRISFTGTDMSFPDKQRKLLQLIRTASAEGDCTVADCLCKRYASLWDVERIKEELGSSAHASFDGAQQLSMVEGISNLFLSSFVNYLAWAVAKLLRDTNPERLNTSSILQFFWGMLERMDIRPLHELKLLNPVWNVALPDTAEIFPFFASISSGIDELVEAAIQEKAPELDDLQQVRKWQAQELVEVAEAVQAKLSDDPETRRKRIAKVGRGTIPRCCDLECIP